MEIKVSCLNEERAVCPSCGSKNIVGKNGNHTHCGQCGQAIALTVVENIKDNEDPEKFTQMSLFGE